MSLLDGPQAGRELGGDLSEDQHGHAVADTTIGDQLTQPHDHNGPGGHGEHHRDHREELFAVEDAPATRQQLIRARHGDECCRLE